MKDYKNLQQEFNSNEIAHLHDCILEVNKIKPSNEQIAQIFYSCPWYLKEMAEEYGMNDTVWRDHFIEWYSNEQ